nr:ATP-dependent helicase [Pseudodesulfovibrio sp.]
MSQTNSCKADLSSACNSIQFCGNTEQTIAYASKDNCVVLAGPGSGKTYTLTHKVAKTLKEDVPPPRRTACITYSKQCVRDLKRQLMRLGIRSGKRITIGTVHSFCLQHIILPFGRYTGVPIPSPFKIGSSTEINILKQQAFDNCGVNSYWTSQIDYHRRIYIDRESEDWRERDEEAATIIEEYEGLLLSHGFVDFDWIVLTSLQIVKNHKWIQKALAAQFPVLFIDEYQDLGVALHEIVKILCKHAGIRIVAVGDPDQSIYGFSGAKPELIRELSTFPRFETVQLKLNYRCGNSIIQASEIALGTTRGCKSHSGEQGELFFHHYPNSLSHQSNEICSTVIPDILKRNPKITIGDIGVFYLDKYDGDIVSESVSKQGWDYIRVDGNSPYQPSPITYWLEECAAWCAGGWQKGDPALSSIINQWLRFNESLSSDSEIRAARSALVQFLYENKNAETLLNTWLEQIMSTFLEKTLKKEPRLSDDKEKVQHLFNITSSGKPLSKLTVASFGGQGRSPNHLNLTTLHSAKGLEFEAVIMLGLEEGRIPWTSDGEGTLREKRRLFYVGLTRAKKEVHLVYSGQYKDRWGNDRIFGPSRFVREIEASITTALETKSASP